MKLERVGDGPVLMPRKDVPWEKDAVLNTAATHAGGKFHLFYRAVAHNPGDRNRSCIGHAWSQDGVHFERADDPILRSNECPEETQGVEDPRITKIGNTYHLVYTAWNNKQVQIAQASSRDLKQWTRHGIMFGYDQMGNNKNGALFPGKVNGEYALIHRPLGFGVFDDSGEKTPLDMWISFSPDLVQWHGHQRLLETRRGQVAWEHRKVGVGASPIKTKAGWLVVYHAVDQDRVYRLALVLLDRKNPLRVLKRSDEPILEPAVGWEVEGDTKNVVFTCGAVLLGTTLWVYYGGADTVIGLAKGDVSEFLGG